MGYDIVRLANGIRVVFHWVPSPITHACMIINAGSRDEPAGQFGLAHFIEHLLFKQTEKRNTNQILNRLESVGGDLNAYTTKEYTCIHASFLTRYLTRALDLFEDLFFHSLFPEREMDKEKNVILDEMASYQDSPEDAILDDFEDQLFRGHGLGHNILGTPEDLKGLSRQHIHQFIDDNYNTDEIVVGISGQYDLRKITALVEKVLGSLPRKTAEKNREVPPIPVRSRVTLQKPINQSHVVIGGTAYNIHDEKKTGLLLLNNLLGGMGMSSRLNLNVRERHGIAYTVESHYGPYSDTGLFYIYFGTDDEKVSRAQRLVLKELKLLRDKKLGVMQLHQAKEKFIGQIALGEENRLSLIISLAKSLMDYDYVQTLDEVFAKIRSVDAEQLMDIANEIFDEDNLSSLSFVPDRA